MASVATVPPWPAFRALALCFIPETSRATEAQWAYLESTVEHALAARPRAVRRQIHVFVRVLSLSARLRSGRGLGGLSAERRTALLDRFARSRLLLFRRGVWGLRTLVMMGWYTNPEVIADLGYRADPAGWDARR